MNEKEEKAYDIGYRAGWTRIFKQASAELDIPLDLKMLANERLDAILCLRDLCKIYGDNDWDDNLHLVDIIEKHLFRHFENKL